MKCTDVLNYVFAFKANNLVCPFLFSLFRKCIQDKERGTCSFFLIVLMLLANLEVSYKQDG